MEYMHSYMKIYGNSENYDYVKDQFYVPTRNQMCSEKAK